MPTLQGGNAVAATVSAFGIICSVHDFMQTEMAGREDTAAILEALKADRTTARERQSALERQIREEARKLRGADGTCEFRQEGNQLTMARRPALLRFCV